MSKTTPTVTIPDKAEPDETVIVGIGASAGGIEALTDFFREVQPDSGMAYVVILHLSPDYDSQLTQVLQSVARIPVTQVTETVKVVVNHIYVVPPNKHLQMEDGDITVHPNTHIEERRAPVDIFLRTLAETHGSRALAVILSGTGANGSMGLKRIKENGGGVFVPSPREAVFSEMPRHAIATDLVDEVLPVGQIPERLQTYYQSLGTITIPVEAQQRPEDQQQALREVFTQLRLRTSHDFSNYKRPTLLRRLARRIHVRNLPDLPAYVTYLRENPEEVQALLKDLLISVTNFFRDSQVFTALDQDVLPTLLQGKKSDDTVRVWVAGCATGEEAYSLAILLAERTLGVLDAPKVQIFATDIDEDAIATAREGLYTLNDAADVSPEQLRRFFTREGDDYRIRREIRETILFAPHNMLKDPPFSRLDLVSCRNVLIYLNQTAQERVLETFHFALNPGGYMLLGTSETVDGSNDLYAIVSREHHLYQSRQVAVRPYPVPEGIPALPIERKPLAEPVPETESRTPLRLNYGDMHQQLLEQYAPPSIIVNEEYDVLHISERAGRYLHIAGGEPTKNLLKLIRPELRLELRTALYQAVQRQTNIDVRNLPLRIADQPETITIHVRPVLREGDPARGFILVLFDPAGDETGEPARVITSVEPVVHQLEEELMRTKTQLRSSNEHHELQAEELKASNEELQAMNEELRSAAEELETGKEELQSLNEELITVNQELKVKVDEISITSNNLQNLINATDIATLFLDRRLRVNLFTPATRQLFNLIPTDSGRPLTDITNRLDYPDLPADAERVLETLQPIEREVRTTDNRTFIMRVLPYRTADDRINGVVVTFVEMTERKAAAESLRQSEEQLSAIVNQMAAGIARGNADGTLTFVNQRYCDLLGYEPAEVLGIKMQDFTHPDDRARNLELFYRLGNTGQPFDVEKRYVRKDGSVVWVHNNVSALYDSEGAITQLLAVSVDITPRKQAEEALRQSEERFRLLTIASSDTLYRMSADWQRMHYLNGGTFLKDTPSTSASWLEQYIPAEDQATVQAVIQQAIQTKSTFELEHRVIQRDGTTGWTFSRAIPVFNEQGDIVEWFGAASDITDRKQAEAALRESEEKYRMLFESIDEGFYLAEAIFDQEGRCIDLSYLDENPAAVRMIGQSAKGRLMSQLVPYEQYWRDIFGETARTGKSQRREEYAGPDGIWYEFYVFKPSQAQANQFVLIFRDVTQRRRAQDALRQSEEKYRTLFESIDEGVAIVEVFPDEQGRVADMIWHEANQGVARHTGGLNFLGKRASEIVPNLEQSWLDTMTGVYQTGESVRMEAYIADLDRWIDTYYSRIGGSGSPLMAAVFQDVTERKQQEQRQAFLLKLSDVLRPLTDPVEVQQAAVKLLAEQLDVMRATYFEVDADQDTFTLTARHERDAVPIPNQMRLSDFAPEMSRAYRSGHTLIFRDTETETQLGSDPAAYRPIGIRAWAAVPLIKNGQLVAIVGVHSRTPRDWTSSEVQLLEETAERTWGAVERAKAEITLRETEQRLASIRPLTLLGQTEELAKIGSWDYNRLTGDFIWSEGMYKLFELENSHPVQPEIYLDVALEVDRSKAQRLVTYLRKGKGQLETDLRIRVTEQVKTLRIKADVIGEGDQKRVLGVDLDITEQIAAQQQIQETAENLQAVLDGSPAAIGLLKTIRDPADAERIIDFELVVGNRKLAEFFRKPLEKLLGQSAQWFSQLLWDGQTLDILRQVRLTGEPRYDEQQLPNTGRWLAISVTHQDDGVLVTALDISDMKTVQEQQQHWLSEVEASRQSVDALRELRDSLSHRSELLRAVSHDLRGNFGVISSALQLLSMAVSEAERAQMIDIVLRNVRQATDMLTELLDYSRLEAGKEQRTIGSFDVTPLLQELTQSLQPAADEQGLQLVHSGPETLVVEGDRLHVYRMAQNLTINAIKYTHTGSIMVNWGSDSQQARWWFSVTDTGPGVDAELVSRLNTNEEDTTGSARPTAKSASASDGREPSTSWTKLRGEGIGLRIVRQLAHLLNARLEVSSEAGVGTRFVVSFPLRYE